jgi:hypothetical protein
LSTSLSNSKGKDSLKFKCSNHHIFYYELETIESLLMESPLFNNSVNEAATSDDCIWCYRCKKFYQQCEEVAATVGIDVVDGLYSNKINLRC